ncbi:MAG: BspA family leucine-rich repeat surface protein [Segatella copri]|nr:BspA family leucine-rich repeat surface protein [Segatella copri]
MKKFTNQFNGSHADRINNGGGRFRRIALFPLMLLMLLLVPTSMVAQTDYDNTVTFTALGGNPQGFTNETYAELFDGKKTEGDFSKWCCKFSGSANVIFEASKAGVPVGYTITTGNDNFTSKGRNPMSWKLYGNNVGKDGEWTLIQEVNNDTKLQDVNYTSYDFTCGGGKSYKYFKWEISAIHSGDVLQVGEFELKLQTCTHTNADGTSALGDPIENVETTCTEHGYTTYNCSICHSTVKKYKTDELKKHTLTHHEATDAIKEHWLCNVCHKYFSDADATQEVSYASLLYKGYAVFDGSTRTLTFRYGPSKPEGAYDLNEGTSSPAWEKQRANIEKVVFDASFANARPTSCYKWFWAFNNLAQIEGIEYLNTEKVTNMDWMFSGYSNLPSLDLSNFDTRNVTSMRGMFNACKGIGSLDLSNFNTQNVTDMCCMFWTCSELTSLDLTNFDTQNVKDMSAMFIDCSNLTTIYVGDKFVTTNVSNGSNMFAGCEKLKNYDRSKTNHNYANCGTDGYFTPGCGYAEFDNATETLTFRYKGVKPEGAYDLNEGEGRPAWINQSDNIKKVVFDTSFAMARPTSCYWWFAGCKNLTEIEGVENLNTRNVTSMRNMFDACSNLESLDLSNFDTQNVIYMNYMFYGCSKLTSLDLSKFNNQKVTGMISMFEGCSGLKSLNLSKFNTQSVTDMSNMFYGCSGLTSLDLSNFNTQNVEYMGSMFKGCTGLTSLNLSMFNTQNVTNMGWMFMGCSSLESLNLSNFDTQNVKHMSDMFSGCSALTSLDLSMFNTQNVEYMSCMFMGCSGLTSLDLSKFDTQKLQGMSGMFSGCSGLTSLDLSKFDTQNVFDMMSVFENCSGLTSLDLSNFNTQNVEFMLSMFKGCSGLTSLDLSNFDTKKVERMSDMFSGCSSLTTIYASDKFVITEHSYGIAMFSGCTLLKGVIAYGEDKTDHTYANYKTGYFTKLVGKNGNEKIGASGETLTAASLALDDEKDFVAYESFSVKAASYSREMKEGTIWATLCLPFEVSLADKNFRAFKLLSANESTSTIQLEEITTSITAGTPVIIKMNNGETTLSISEANKEIAQKVVSAADGSYQLQGIYTQKVFDKSADDNCYIVKGDKLMNPTKLLENTSTTQVGSKPFRAYMVDNTSSSAGAKMFSIAIGDNTTAIDSLNTIADDNAIYYDLQGNRLSAPQKGINIVKRGSKTMKVIIK